MLMSLMLVVVLMVRVHLSLGVAHVKDCIDCVGTLMLMSLMLVVV